MAPEQARGEPADSRADIFAFGAVLYEMLSGRQAFHRATPVDTMTAILRDDPPPLPREERGIAPALERLVAKCLEKAPGARLQSAADIAFALEGLSSHIDSTRVFEEMVGWRHWSRERVAWSAITAGLVLAIAGLASTLSLRNPAATTDVVRATVELPSRLSMISGGVDHSLAVSPDGRRVAFVADGPDGVRQLSLRRIDGVRAQPLAGTANARDPFWSPDSRFIAFFADGKLKKMDASGGPVLVLCDAASGAGGTWNDDDVIVFSDFSALHRVDASGGTPVLLAASGDGDPTNLQFPFFLPDGDHFIHRGRDAQTYLRSLSTGEVRLLGAGGNAQYAQGHVVVWRDGALVAQALDTSSVELTGELVTIAEDVRGGTNGAAFSISSTGVLVYQQAASEAESQLTWVDRSGREIGRLGDPDTYGDLELSPDGARLAVSVVDRTRRTRDIWLFDLRRGVRSAFTFDQAQECASAWSPDGSRIVFDSNRRGTFDLYEKPSNGASEETFLFGSERAADGAYSWSLDGRHLLVQAGAGGTEDLFALPLADRTTIPILTTPAATVHGRFSPDGRWIAYMSTETGQNEVWVASFPRAVGRWRVSTGQGAFPRWRRDGREIFYIDPAANRLMAAAVNGDGAAIEVHNVTPLFEARARTEARYMYDVSADGQRFLINRLPDQPATPPLSLVLNWPALLQQ